MSLYKPLTVSFPHIPLPNLALLGASHFTWSSFHWPIPDILGLAEELMRVKYFDYWFMAAHFLIFDFTKIKKNIFGLLSKNTWEWHMWIYNFN